MAQYTTPNTYIPGTDDADELARIVMLTYGPMQEGKGAFWCYVAVRPSQYERFQQVQKAKKLDLRLFEMEGFGEIVVSGTGVYPPQEVTRQVAQMFDLPLKDLFRNHDPQAVIAAKIAELKNQEKRDA